MKRFTQDICLSCGIHVVQELHRGWQRIKTIVFFNSVREVDMIIPPCSRPDVLFLRIIEPRTKFLGHMFHNTATHYIKLLLSRIDHVSEIPEIFFIQWNRPIITGDQLHLQIGVRFFPAKYIRRRKVRNFPESIRPVCLLCDQSGSVLPDLLQAVCPRQPAETQ